MSNETPQGAALELLRLIAFNEGKEIDVTKIGNTSKSPNRAWILWTYAQCMQIVSVPGTVKATLAWEVPK
jgi:hypothetical protein